MVIIGAFMFGFAVGGLAVGLWAECALDRMYELYEEQEAEKEWSLNPCIDCPHYDIYLGCVSVSSCEKGE